MWHYLLELHAAASAAGADERKRNEEEPRHDPHLPTVRRGQALLANADGQEERDRAMYDLLQ